MVGARQLSPCRHYGTALLIQREHGVADNNAASCSSLSFSIVAPTAEAVSQRAATLRNGRSRRMNDCAVFVRRKGRLLNLNDGPGDQRDVRNSTMPAEEEAAISIPYEHQRIAATAVTDAAGV